MTTLTLTFEKYDTLVKERISAFQGDYSPSSVEYRRALNDLRMIPDSVPVFCSKEELEEIIQQAVFVEVCSEGEFHKLVYITNFGESPFYAAYMEDLKPL